MTTATGPRIQSGRRVQHRNSLHPNMALCECCKPHARHHFGEQLLCRCGVSHYEHQANPQRCEAPPHLTGGDTCHRGHPKDESNGKWYREGSTGKWRWVCRTCQHHRNLGRRVKRG